MDISAKFARQIALQYQEKEKRYEQIIRDVNKEIHNAASKGHMKTIIFTEGKWSDDEREYVTEDLAGKGFRYEWGSDDILFLSWGK